MGTGMRSSGGLWHPQNFRLLRLLLGNAEKTSATPLCTQFARGGGGERPTFRPLIPRRYATTRATKKVKELQQGVLQAAPLPDQEPDNAFQWPTTLREVRNNMIKFDKCVLLTRVGNFYELYWEQAEEFGPLLNMKVGEKRVGEGKSVVVPMAGFPFFQLDRFLKILVQDLNKYVAICDEFDIPDSEKVKGGLIKERRVTRVISPGTLIDEKFLDPYENNFLLAIHPEQVGSHVQTNQGTTAVGLAWIDLSTGGFFTQSTSTALLASAVARIAPREIILSDKVAESLKNEVDAVTGPHRHLLTVHASTSKFLTISEWNDMLETPVDPSLESTFTKAEAEAGHQLLDYVRTRLRGFETKLQQPHRKQQVDILSIDRSSLRGLEIFQTARDGLGKGSLLHAVNRTVTKSGARLLKDRLTSPSVDLAEINTRLDLVEILCNGVELRDDLYAQLRCSFDVQRLVQKFALNKGDPDDLVDLARAITATAAIKEILEQHQRQDLKLGSGLLSHSESGGAIEHLLRRLDLEGSLDLRRHIVAAIDEEGLNQLHRLEDDESTRTAALTRKIVESEAGPDELESLPRKVTTSIVRANDAQELDGENEAPWIMRRNASEMNDRLHLKLDQLKQDKISLTHTLRQKLGLAKDSMSLSLKWTPGLGHICHLKNGNKSTEALQSLNARLVSSTKSTRSFYLTEWTRLGKQMEQTRMDIQSEEKKIFFELRHEVIRNLVKLRRNAAVLDELDVACSFAALATQQGLIRPILTQGTEHKIIGGRHPTVKLGLEEQGRSFVSNDLFVGDRERIWLVTGPNMAGKSTFLRQNALITILAQVGSYVPAEYAEIGLVDQIFSRIGAADDLFRDQSTFMVEMLETATILRQATPRSFVIMDEVGRGTTPEDGTAVGYACLHHLYHRNQCRTLFATHFHALADMTEDFQHLGRYCTDVLEDAQGSFSFVHRLRPGVNRQSHALKVAKLAGLPEPALDVAREVLQHLLAEKHNLRQTPVGSENFVSAPLAVAAG